MSADVDALADLWPVPQAMLPDIQDGNALLDEGWHVIDAMIGDSAESSGLERRSFGEELHEPFQDCQASDRCAAGFFGERCWLMAGHVDELHEGSSGGPGPLIHEDQINTFRWLR